jgi:hypothetical protein
LPSAPHLLTPTLSAPHPTPLQALLVYAANAEDDKKDDDRDGVPDTSQLTDPKELLQRKMRVVGTNPLACMRPSPTLYLFVDTSKLTDPKELLQRKMRVVGDKPTCLHASLSHPVLVLFGAAGSPACL